MLEKLSIVRTQYQRLTTTTLYFFIFIFSTISPSLSSPMLHLHIKLLLPSIIPVFYSVPACSQYPHLHSKTSLFDPIFDCIAFILSSFSPPKSRASISSSEEHGVQKESTDDGRQRHRSLSSHARHATPTTTSRCREKLS